VPERIQVDNGSGFISKTLDKWAYDNTVFFDFSCPEKTTDNPHVESSNGSFRDKCLNVPRFFFLEDARKKIETWRRRIERVPAIQFAGVTCRQTLYFTAWLNGRGGHGCT